MIDDRAGLPPDQMQTSSGESVRWVESRPEGPNGEYVEYYGKRGNAKDAGETTHKLTDNGDLKPLTGRA